MWYIGLDVHTKKTFVCILPLLNHALLSEPSGMIGRQKTCGKKQFSGKVE